MRLSAVRLIKTKEPVGFFWVSDLSALWWMIDSVTDPGACEYSRIRHGAAVAWNSRVNATFGTGKNRDKTEGKIDNFEAIRRGASFEFGFDDYIYGVVENWIKVPFADEPGGGAFELVEEAKAAKPRRPNKSN
jgi:hypothetical protein